MFGTVTNRAGKSLILKNPWKNAQWNEAAYALRKQRKIVIVNSTLTSESGDWVKYVYHYFRADGSLAKVKSNLNTFYGNFRFAQNIYFDRKGNVLKRTSHFSNLETNKPIVPSRDDIENNESNLKEFYYKKISRLPFNLLLNKKR